MKKESTNTMVKILKPGCIFTILLVLFISCADSNVKTKKINDKLMAKKALVPIFNDVDKVRGLLFLPVSGKMSPWLDNQMGGYFSINEESSIIYDDMGIPLADFSFQLMSGNEDYITEMELSLFLFPSNKLKTKATNDIVSTFIKKAEVTFGLLDIVLPDNLSDSIKKGTEFNFENESIFISFKVIKGINKQPSYDYILSATTKLTD